VAVWNLGWPLATAIYDSRRGLHVGPMAYVAALLQGGLLTAGVIAVVVVQWLMGMGKSAGDQSVEGGRSRHSDFPWPTLFFAVNFTAAILLIFVGIMAIVDGGGGSPYDFLASSVLMIPTMAFA
jgi:hypothetical protein